MVKNNFFMVWIVEGKAKNSFYFEFIAVKK